MEQFSLTLQYVDGNMEVHSDLFGFYNAPTAAEIICSCRSKMHFASFPTFPIESLQEYCFDGASNRAATVPTTDLTK